MFSRRGVLAAGLAAPFVLTHSAVAGLTPHSIDELIAAPRDRDATLSPDGLKIAVASTEMTGEDDSKSYVSIIPVEDPTKTLAVVPLGDHQVQSIAWANDTRLLVTVLANTRKSGGSGFPDKVRRVVAVDVDGKNSIMLFNDGTQKLREIYDLGTIVDLLPDDPEHILMIAWNTNVQVFYLYKVDVYAGRVETVERGTLRTSAWLTQGGVPVVRYDDNDQGTIRSIYLRPPGAKDWTFYRKLRSDQLNKQDFEFVGAAAEPGVMLAIAPGGPSGALALRKFDLRTQALGEVLASRPDRDVESILKNRKGQLLAVSFIEDRCTYQFTDPKMTAHFRGLNKFLGDVCNIRIFDVSDDGARFLAWVTGPREPGTIYFYDRDAKRFDGVGQSRPGLSPDRLAPMETLTAKTRDGVTITAYLTTPLATGPRPLVVMPHGGPELRDSYDYDTFAQVLAARGWLVLQPNFRGSGGYGKAFADAGRKHWGDRMQEDVEDVVAQLVASGRVEAGKIAICGASYGGYAALQGAVRRPDLYKAVVAMAGDCDLVETIAFSKQQDGADAPSYFYWLETIGDPAKDRAMLEASSPALHADQIQAPVLLIHGTEDVIVAPKQSRIMLAALKAAGKPVELIELKGAGHRNLTSKDWKLVYARTVDHITKAFA